VDAASGSTVREGQDVTYTLHFENIGEAPIAVDRVDDLTQVLDDATVTAQPVSSDSALAASEITDGRFAITGSLEPGDLVTVSYSVKVNVDGARGDDRLANYLLDPDTSTPDECIPADDEFPDCTVNHVSDVTVVKSSDPESGTEVRPNSEVTYTLTFTNVSNNPDSEPAEVDYTDHMADVLDDATLTAGPQASSGDLTATATGNTIRIIGAVPAGKVVTVSYTVTVKSFDAQGNHELGNVVAVTGEEPVCTPDSPLCTEHHLVMERELPRTGGTIAWDKAGLALLLILGGGGAILVSRKRRPGT